MSLLDQLEAAGESCTPGIRAAFLELERLLAAAQVRIAELEELLGASYAGVVTSDRAAAYRSQCRCSRPGSLGVDLRNVHCDAIWGRR